MTREDITRFAKEIKQHLRRRSGKSWSVTSDTRSTAYGSITIEVPQKAYGTPEYRALSEELSLLLGFHEDRGGQILCHARDQDYLQRAMGLFVNPETCGGCGKPEYRWKAPYCDRCQYAIDHPHYD